MEPKRPLLHDELFQVEYLPYVASLGREVGQSGKVSKFDVGRIEI